MNSGGGAAIPLGTIDRQGSRDVPIGVSLGEGSALLASAQESLVRAQCHAITAAQEQCAQCDKTVRRRTDSPPQSLIDFLVCRTVS